MPKFIIASIFLLLNNIQRGLFIFLTMNFFLFLGCYSINCYFCTSRNNSDPYCEVTDAKAIFEILSSKRSLNVTSHLTFCLPGPHGPDLHQLHQELSSSQGGTLGTVPGQLLCQDDWDLWCVENNENCFQSLSFRSNRWDPCDKNLCSGGYEQSVWTLQVPGEIISNLESRISNIRICPFHRIEAL